MKPKTISRAVSSAEAVFAEKRTGASKDEEVVEVRSEPYRTLVGDVYHVFENCVDGNNIEKRNRRPGTGGRPLCDKCATTAQATKPNEPEPAPKPKPAPKAGKEEPAPVPERIPNRFLG